MLLQFEYALTQHCHSFDIYILLIAFLVGVPVKMLPQNMFESKSAVDVTSILNQFKAASAATETSINILKDEDANAIMSIGQKENILCINESLLQFNRITDKPFVEILKDDGSFVTKEVEVGISDGINVEILKGIKEGDKIKVWNSVEDEDEDEARRRQDDNSRELED